MTEERFLKKLALVLTCLLLILLPCFSYSYAQDENEDFQVNYKDYLKNNTKLGFSPDYRLFKASYMVLKSKYVVVPEDSALLSGVSGEINKLLKQAGVKERFAPNSFAAVKPGIEKFSAKGVPASLLWFSAIQGMLFSLKDPYTLLLTPDQYSNLMEQMEASSFGGVGLYLDADKNNANKLTVFEPIEGTPAYRAGLLPEDNITSINGEKTEGMPIELAVKKLRGPVGSVVTVTVKRKGAAKLLTFKLKREKITIHSVSCRIIDKHYGYIRVRTFGENTSAEFAKALSILNDRNVKGIIIDLRNNGGGLIQAAVEMGNFFIERGKPIVSVTPRNSSREFLRSSGSTASVSVPIVVMINKYSASASEIFSGAMQDYGLAVIFGAKSYGKGSVQEVIPLSSGAAFKMTIAHYFTPKNRDIDKKGIVPDVKNEMDVKLVGRKTGDSQLKAAVSYLRSRQ